jgi:hypothetical protein
MADTISRERLDEIIEETGVDEVIIMNTLSYVGIRLEDPEAMRTVKVR